MLIITYQIKEKRKKRIESKKLFILDNNHLKLKE